MRLYLDNCCLNRPFDDQSNLRIHLESEAIKVIFKQCETRIWQLVLSDVSIFEISRTPILDRRQKLMTLIGIQHQTIALTTEIQQRANHFITYGIKTFDALHLASAENHADLFLTVDDKLYKKALSIYDLQIVVSTPLLWINEVLQ